jgi:iron complex transport system ATP-binding protein
MNILGAYGISFSVRGCPILSEVSFEIERPQVLALFGPNGSGKTTLLKTIAGIQEAQSGLSGTVRLKGQDFLSQSSLYRARHLAYVPADLYSEFPISAEEAVRLGRICHAGESEVSTQAAIDSAMQRCFCAGLKNRMLQSLSGGERQLVSLARALAQGAKVLLLDESLSKMDLNHQASVGRLFRELCREGYTIVIVSHDVNLATEWADSILLLQLGKKIAFGPVKETLTLDALRKLYPDTELALTYSPESGAPKVIFKNKA